MTPDSLSARIQIGGLLVLTASSVVSFVYVIFARTPAPPALAPGPLEVPGYRLHELPGQPARTGHRLSRSSLRRWEVRAVSPHEPPLELKLVNLHSRSRRTFQLAALTSGMDSPPDLALRQRRLLPSAEAAIGSLEQTGERVVLKALQSCLITANKSRPLGSGEFIGGVTQKQLTGQLEWQRHGRAGLQGLWRELPPLLGLEPDVRWQCLLVSVETTGEAPRHEAALTKFWRASAPRLVRMSQ